MEIVIKHTFLKEFQYSEELHELQNNLPLLPERITTENVKKKCSDLA